MTTDAFDPDENEERYNYAIVADAAGIEPRRLELWAVRGWLPRHPAGSIQMRLFTRRHMHEVAWMARLTRAGFTAPAAGRLAVDMAAHGYARMDDRELVIMHGIDPEGPIDDAHTDTDEASWP